MAGRTPARKTSGAFSQGSLPSSPLGATPRPHLRQVYPKLPQGSYLSEYELSKSSGGDYTKVTRSSKTSYTVLRSQDDNDAVDSAVPAEAGSSTKSFVILGLVFLLSLVALGVVYKTFPKLEK